MMLWCQYKGGCGVHHFLCACKREYKLHIYTVVTLGHELQLCILGFHVIFSFYTTNKHTPNDICLYVTMTKLTM